MKNLIFLSTGLVLFSFNLFSQTTVTDYDGNVYNTVTIGSQIWIAENLKVTHFRNGDDIPNVTSPSLWDSLTTGASCDYNNDSSISSIYGKLYNWYTINDSRNIAPIGWHVPSNAEWSTLITYLGGDSVAGNKLKEIGTTHWQAPNSGATNESGFTALPSGARNTAGTFSSFGIGEYWWSSTEFSPGNAYYRRIDNVTSSIYVLKNRAEYGLSVRCLRDSTSSINEINYNKNIQIYPNPVNTIAYITDIDNKNVRIQVYDMIGKCVFENTLTRGANYFDLSRLIKGVYLTKLTINNNYTVLRKLIKE